jgi:hypothetical protein
LFHQTDSGHGQGRFDVGQVVAVLEEHGICSSFRVMIEIGKGLVNDRLLAPGVQGCARQWRERNHRRQEFIGKRSGHRRVLNRISGREQC